ncbi:MAG: YIP1 family protein [Dehalococcoidia bacterium]|nr:YIP1 family protein [Dehalococcoidia bacterium]
MSAYLLSETLLKTVLKALDTLSGVVLSPSGTVEQITNTRPIGFALFAAACVGVVTGLVLVPNPPELAEVIFDQPKGTLSLWALLPAWVALFLTVICCQAAFVHFLALLLRCQGTFVGILCGVCFAYIPGLFSAPLVMLRAVFASDNANAFYQVAFPLLCLWVFVLGTMAIRHNYRMKPAKALLVSSVAFFALVVAPIVAAVVIMTAVMT